MAIQLGDEAPDFTAETTEGTVKLYDYLGDSWGVLFSHPKDFTPVCTTELGAVARLKSEFDKLTKGATSALGQADQLERATLRVREIAAMIAARALKQTLLMPDEVSALARSLESRRV